MAKWRLNDVIHKKWGITLRIFFSKCITGHAEQIWTRYTSLKNQIKERKRRLSQKITEKRQDYGYMTSYVKNETCYEKENISKCISDHAEQFLPI